MHRMATDTYVVLKNRLDEAIEQGRERGLTTTEIAVLTFVLVAMAAAVGAILWQYVTERVDALPENPAVNIGGTGTN